MLCASGLNPVAIRNFIQPIIDEECDLDTTISQRPKVTVSSCLTVILIEQDCVYHNSPSSFERYFSMKLTLLHALDF